MEIKRIKIKSQQSKIIQTKKMLRVMKKTIEWSQKKVP